MKRRLLIDGDEVAYKATCLSGRAIKWDQEAPVESYDTGLAIHTAFAMLASWEAETKSDTPLVCFSCEDRNIFRKHIYAGYKAGRKEEKPSTYWAVVKKLKDEYPWRELPMLEADDVMGLMSGDEGYENIIASSDKDMRTLPCRFYDPYHKLSGNVKPWGADYQWMFQTLVGDVSDGYKCCPGVVEKTAKALLSGGLKLRDMWNIVVEQFRKKERPDSDAITQARLARILRPGDYDMATGTINLWHPSGTPQKFETKGNPQ